VSKTSPIATDRASHLRPPTSVGAVLGAAVGEALGLPLGAAVGVPDGAADGDAVGASVGCCEGCCEGELEGLVDGALVGGEVVGLCVGEVVGRNVGRCVGLTVGAVGRCVGDVVGACRRMGWKAPVCGDADHYTRPRKRGMPIATGRASHLRPPTLVGAVVGVGVGWVGRLKQLSLSFMMSGALWGGIGEGIKSVKEG
jgi:hypothetical protein